MPEVTDAGEILSYGLVKLGLVRSLVFADVTEVPIASGERR